MKNKLIDNPLQTVNPIEEIRKNEEKLWQKMSERVSLLANPLEEIKNQENLWQKMSERVSLLADPLEEIKNQENLWQKMSERVSLPADRLQEIIKNTSLEKAWQNEKLLEDLFRPLSCIERYNQSSSRRLWGIDISNFSVIDAINEQLKWCQQPLGTPLYQLLNSLENVDGDVEFEEEAKIQQLWSIIHDFLTNLITSFPISWNSPLSEELVTKLFDYIISIAIAYYFFTLSASNVDMQSIKAISSHTQEQVQKLNDKVDSLITLLEQNKSNISATTSFYKTVDKTLVYVEAGKKADVISVLLKDQIVIAISSDNSWVEIQFPDYVLQELRNGWVQESFLEAIAIQKQSSDPDSLENQVITHFQASLKRNYLLGKLLA
jgi:RNAse (barnase) inhibitor barstar